MIMTALAPYLVCAPDDDKFQGSQPGDEVVARKDDTGTIRCCNDLSRTTRLSGTQAVQVTGALACEGHTVRDDKVMCDARCQRDDYTTQGRGGADSGHHIGLLSRTVCLSRPATPVTCTSCAPLRLIVHEGP